MTRSTSVIPSPRLRGPAYDEFIEAFVAAVVEVYPDVVLQWEDFKQHNAIRLLDRYRHRSPASTTTSRARPRWSSAGILAALRRRGEPMARQRMVFVGAGAAGTGIARLIEAIMRAEGAHEEEIRRAGGACSIPAAWSSRGATT